ncbi:slit homolog 2 protein-like [Saccostrea cucullata]|uniref:slit homolog 2 protein-like n=1 Tax=Saccostrea cuccullata TaxID=36930 RepID=UPI002ED364DB
MRWFDTEHKMHILQIILMTEILMMHYSALTPVVCPKECSCGSIFGLKPYVKCDHVQAEYVYKVIAEIPQNTEEMQIIEELFHSESQGSFTAVFICQQKEDILNFRYFQRYHDCPGRHISESGDATAAVSRVLDLCHNKIQNIDERAFTDAWKLRILKLCHNKLKQLKKNLFLSNVELVSLYLENNFFENIPIVSLKVLKNLKLLDLSANNIQFIPSLSALSSIKFLYLSNNKIRTIASNAFDGLQHLSMLLLSGNKINNLPEEMSIQFHLMDLGQIILHDNPLTCSCQNWWLISWQKKRCKLHNNTKECALMCFQNGTSLLMENFDLNNLICGMF